MTANTSHSGVKRTPARICVFCREKHYSNQCTVMLNIKARKVFLPAHGHSFSCLNTGHISRNCGSKTYSFLTSVGLTTIVPFAKRGMPNQQFQFKRESIRELVEKVQKGSRSFEGI